MKRIRVRVLLGYGAQIDGELVERAPGEEVEEEAVLARQMIAANWAELVDPPKTSLTAAEANALRDEQTKSRAAAEAKAHGIEASVDEAPERAARTGRTGR